MCNRKILESRYNGHITGNWRFGSDFIFSNKPTPEHSTRLTRTNRQCSNSRRIFSFFRLGNIFCFYYFSIFSRSINKSYNINITLGICCSISSCRFFIVIVIVSYFLALWCVFCKEIVWLGCSQFSAVDFSNFFKPLFFLFNYSLFSEMNNIPVILVQIDFICFNFDSLCSSISCSIKFPVIDLVSICGDCPDSSKFT